jgi:hypothetical protein
MRKILLCVILAVAIFLAMAPHACSYPCKFSSEARPGLTRHQQQCVIHKTTQVLRMEQRKAREASRAQSSNQECRRDSEAMNVSLYIVIEIQSLTIDYRNEESLVLEIGSNILMSVMTPKH